MRSIVTNGLALVILAAANPTFASNGIIVEITNLKNAIYITPLLVTAHSRRVDLFEVGEPAIESLQRVAEGGDIEGLATEARAARSAVSQNPANGLLAPGQTVKARLNIRPRHSRLSVTAMMLPTNDGFIGLDSARIPESPGTVTFYLPGSDAGTEANDEKITGGGAPGAPGILADPGDNAGTRGRGVTGPDHDPTVHVHRDNVDDKSRRGGPSDLDEAVHRWLNPVARVVLTVR